jgi:hypothetical protein
MRDFAWIKGIGHDFHFLVGNDKVGSGRIKAIGESRAKVTHDATREGLYQSGLSMEIYLLGGQILRIGHF